MTEPKKKWRISSLFKGLWKTLDISRRIVLNLLFLIIVVAIIASLRGETVVPLQDKSVLVLDLQGELVEERITDFQTSLLSDGQPLQIQLRDVLAVLDAAAKDEKIERVLLMLDGFGGLGTASLHELSAALERFKASGKPVIAWGNSYSQSQFYLAAHADKVYLHPMGQVIVNGYGGESNYYKDALAKLGVTVNVIHAGAYKNAGETFTANEPSPETLEANAYVLDALWNNYTADIEQLRDLSAGSIMDLINALPEPLEKAQGSLAEMAVQAGWVDAVKTLPMVRDELIASGAKNKQGNSFRQVAFHHYLQRLPKPTPSKKGIGVIVAEGAITNGVSTRGNIGGESMAARIRKARQDGRIKALVMRVNSPGGAVLGSEVIRQELAQTREAGKPVIVSMGDVAASGGYWLAMGADQVFADPGTITGSIGVVTMLPSFPDLMDKLAIHQGGYQTTWLPKAFDPRHPLDPRMRRMLESHIGHIYQQFLSKVATARDTSVEAIDNVAQGRIWTGSQAQERGLIDELGGLHAAIQAARQQAELGEAAPIHYIEPDLSPFEEALKMLGMQATDWVEAALPQWLTQASRQMPSELDTLLSLVDKEQAYTTLLHCLCTPKLD